MLGDGGFKIDNLKLNVSDFLLLIGDVLICGFFVLSKGCDSGFFSLYDRVIVILDLGGVIKCLLGNIKVSSCISSQSTSIIRSAFHCFVDCLLVCQQLIKSLFLRIQQSLLPFGACLGSSGSGSSGILAVFGIELFLGADSSELSISGFICGISGGETEEHSCDKCFVHCRMYELSEGKGLIKKFIK